MVGRKITMTNQRSFGRLRITVSSVEICIEDAIDPQGQNHKAHEPAGKEHLSPHLRTHLQDSAGRTRAPEATYEEPQQIGEWAVLGSNQ